MYIVYRDIAEKYHDITFSSHHPAKSPEAYEINRTVAEYMCMDQDYCNLSLTSWKNTNEIFGIENGIKYFPGYQYRVWNSSEKFWLRKLHCRDEGKKQHKKKNNNNQKSHTYRDVGKSCPHHEVEDPGLQLQDVGWRVDHPNGGQHKQKKRREERQ